MIMMITFFRHDTPVYLKQVGRMDELRILMNKLYTGERVQHALDSLGGDAEEG